MRRWVCAAHLAALAVLLGICASPASASTGRIHFGSFGPDGTEETSYFPHEIERIAFDQANNDLLAITQDQQHGETGADCIARFHTTEAGLPARPKGFPAAGGGQLCGFAGEPLDVAVDNTGTGSQGRIYVVEFFSTIRAFGPDGTEVGGNFPLEVEALGGARAVAVDSLGHLWVGIGGNVREYDSSGNLLGEPVKPSGSVGDLELDSEDNLYAQLFAAKSAVWRYSKASNYTSSEAIDPANSLKADGTIAVDGGNDHLLVYRADNGLTQEVDEYDLTLPGYPEVEGSPVAERPAISQALGLAVDEESGVIYLADLAAPSVIEVYSRYGTHPEVATGGASNVTNSTATLEGAVDPEATATECHFEYGPTATYGTNVPCASSPGSGKGVVAVHADLAGLKSSSAYHYRLVAQNSIGVVPGEDVELTTFGPPAISDTGFDSAGTTEATVSAKINPANQTSAYWVEYTSEAAYQANTPGDEQQSLAVGASSGTFRLSFEGQKTPPLAFDVSATDLQATLNALPAISDVGGSVAVSGGPGDAAATSPYAIVFGGTLGGEDVAQITADGADLKGGTGAAVQTTTPGHSRFAGAQRVPVPDGQIVAGTQPVLISETIPGLAPDSAYRFRFVAANVSGTRRGEAVALATYPPEPPQTDCPNQALRSGPSAGLPDCRAYEVVSEGMHGLVPQGILLGTAGIYLGTEFASPDGESVIFHIGGATLPGEEGTNGTNDRFESVREAGGWHTRLASMSGQQGTIAHPGGSSSDHGYSIWQVESCCGGSLSDPSSNSIYLRRPDGSFELVGQGEPGFESDREARAKWITPQGSHVIFTAGDLMPGVPPSGGIYDRTPQGLRVVSLLPEEQQLGAGESAEYKGVSADGSAVAFTVKGKAPLYLRIEGKETVPVVSGATFAGLSANGDRLFYLKNGDLSSYDSSEEVATPVTKKAEATVVNIAANGSHAYFVSAKVLDEGKEGTLGANNLYVWDEQSAQTRFIAVLDPADLSGDVNLGRWISDVLSPNQSNGVGPANDPSRTTPDGSAIVFESQAQLSAYENAGHREVYRYDAEADSLDCLSCSPVGARARSDAALQALERRVLGPLTLSHNISDDGRRAFFETADALVQGDTDGVTDVYEWEAQGKGSCEEPGGCHYLISSGKSVEAQTGSAGNYLYSVTPDGEDVFIRSNDTLVPDSGEGQTAVIYDARVDGGFAYPPPPPPCQGDACKGSPSTAPTVAGAGSAVFAGPGNPEPKAPRCPKSKRQVRKAGKTRCVKRAPKHSNKHHHNRKGASTASRGAAAVPGR